MRFPSFNDIAYPYSCGTLRIHRNLSPVIQDYMPLCYATNLDNFVANATVTLRYGFSNCRIVACCCRSVIVLLCADPWLGETIRPLPSIAPCFLLNVCAPSAPHSLASTASAELREASADDPFNYQDILSRVSSLIVLLPIQRPDTDCPG